MGSSLITYIVCEWNVLECKKHARTKSLVICGMGGYIKCMNSTTKEKLLLVCFPRENKPTQYKTLLHFTEQNAADRISPVSNNMQQFFFNSKLNSKFKLVWVLKGKFSWSFFSFSYIKSLVTWTDYDRSVKERSSW